MENVALHVITCRFQIRKRRRQITMQTTSNIRNLFVFPLGGTTYQAIGAASNKQRTKASLG
jgi:hypothetical protein